MEGTTDSGHNLEPIDFLIVTALPEERDAILHLLEDYQQVRIDESVVCYMCTLPAKSQECHYRIAVTQLCQVGNIEAGIHATRAIVALKPSHVLMVGIAAGVKDRVSLGDVIVPTLVLYYEQAKQKPNGLEHRPVSLPVDHSLLHSAQNYIGMDWHELIAVRNFRGNSDESVSSVMPTVHFGPFAAGEKVIAAQRSVDELLHLHPKLVGIDMESYGVALAANTAPTRPGFLAIRGVSDFANEEKNDDWHGRASANAAAFTIGFLHSGPVVPRGSLRQSMTLSPKHTKTLIAIRHLSMEFVPPQTIVDSLPSQFAGFSITEVPIDQTDLYLNGRLVDPLEAARRQTDFDQRMGSLLQSQSNASVAYYGIAHVPLLFHLGYRLTNKCRLHFFEFDRYAGRWELLQGKADGLEIKLDGLPTQVHEEMGDVLLRISISDAVRVEDVVDIVPSPIASIHLHIQPTKRDVLCSEHQLRICGARFRSLLDSIHEVLPNRRRVHLFYAGPVSLAVYFGQMIRPTIDRRVVVYNYTSKDSPAYSWGLEITAEVDASDFLVKVSRTDEEVA